MFLDFALLERCIPDVHPMVIQKITTVETRQKPYSIGFRIVKDGKDYRLPSAPKTLIDAQYTARWLYDHGYKFDAGIAQINSTNFARLGLTPESIFDPCTNLAASGKILKEFFISAKFKIPNEQDALKAAIRAYNSGKFSSAAGQQYLNKIHAIKVQYVD
jgi:type IV secretion system protein VirB1